MTHGWPGSIIELLEIIGPLTDPTAHGGNEEDAFHLVLPSIPGYGFSDEPTEVGWGPIRIGRAWHELMRRLGYTRYVAQGGDVGSQVTDAMGRLSLDGLLGIHTNLLTPALGDANALSASPPTEEERAALDQLDGFHATGTGYFVEQATRPETIGYALLDSPIALAAWIIDHDTDSYEKIARAFVDGEPGAASSRLRHAMPASIVLGTQWGDEGKGKAVDYLADRMDFVVRYQGGNNAGHTVIAEGRLLKLQLIPSGILYDHITSVIAGGVVVDPRHLIKEMTELRALGVDVSRLVVSGQRPPDHAVPPGAREGDGALPGQERPGDHEARHRSRVRRQGRADRAARPGPVRREDLPREARRGPAREEPDPHEDLQPAAARRRPDRRGVHGPGLAARAARRGHRRAPVPRPAGRQARHARGRAGDAARPRSRDVSVRHVVEPGRRVRPGVGRHRTDARSTA